MINDFLTEKDILDYLMTSDFNDGLTQDESKFLLLKYRNFYRSLHSKYEQSLHTIEEMENKMDENNKQMDLNTELVFSIKNEILAEKNRRLSWKERILGKKINKI